MCYTLTFAFNARCQGVRIYNIQNRKLIERPRFGRYGDHELTHFFLFNFINVCNTCIISVFNCYRNETEVFVLFVKFMESFFFQRKFLVMKLRRKSVWLSMNIGWPMKGDNMNHISWHRRFFLVNGPYLR